MIPDKIISVLERSGTIAIIPHINADGDAIGSSLALALALHGAGKKVKVLLEEDIPYIYSFLPGKDLVLVYANGNPEDSLNGMEFDTVVVLDAGDAGRLGKRKEIFDRCPVTVNIDHHSTNTDFAVYNFNQMSSSAVGEIIFELLNQMKLEITADIAACLYTSITTDTGGFRYSNTTPLTHMIAAELIKRGAAAAEISQMVFDTISYAKAKLMGYALDSLELVENGRISIITLTPEMMSRACASDEDCDGIINFGRGVKGVEVAVMLREMEENDIRVNLRSKGNFDVAALAFKHGGGGHKKAAGCTIKGSLEAVREMLVSEIRNLL